MKLSELVGTLRCEILRDEAEPRLWTDRELVRLLNEAQRNFCIRTHILTDSSSEITTFDTVDGNGAYDLNSKIIFVAEAHIDIDDGNGNFARYKLFDGTRNQIPNTLHRGRPTCYTTQLPATFIRLHPVPDAVYRIQLNVATLPMRKLINGNDVPEIPLEYHHYLLDYAAYRALMNNDPERANMQAAGSFRNAWDLGVRDAKRATALLRSGSTPQARGNWTGKSPRFRLR